MTVQVATKPVDVSYLGRSFWFQQMGGIDEAALDKLSLVTEMTKHIQVRASSSSKGASASEIGQFSPLFLWLLRVSFLGCYGCILYSDFLATLIFEFCEI